MKVLLDAGANPLPAIRSAIQLDDDSAVALLLSYDCPLFPPPADVQEESGYISYANEPVLTCALHWSSRKECIDLIVKKLRNDRRRLSKLAAEALPAREQREIGFDLDGFTGLLDRFAATAFKSLKKRFATIPPALWPGDQSSVYHLSSRFTPSIAERLFSNGFRSIDELDMNGLSPLYYACVCLNWDMISWYLDKGAAFQFSKQDRPMNCIHAIACAQNRLIFPGLRDGPQDIVRKILLRSTRLCGGVDVADSCLCFCSLSGCTALSQLSKRGFLHGKRETGRSRAEDWIALSGSPDQNEVQYENLCRSEIFERLGMAHTCCNHSVPSRTSPFLPEDEIQELREEDAGLKDSLNLYMHTYRRLRHRTIVTWTLDVFWKLWWEVIEPLLPVEPLFSRVSGNGSGDEAEGITVYVPKEESIWDMMHSKYCEELGA
jgi:hypothetical protein